ncbi:DUF1283 family protein [Ignatzschineria rhizosphaerae]|uniref:DUF1283 family protein n=1 Tax=Ignatzschineria rhizosphaerae TaxID=2923279 RepID=A0ABY3X3R2_9GAMM|nr:DUF1283 family protein [Ignatzschineria rhizosphaerae]UNM97524.1 DUF1283 family protein [Ignatzschineria rhizosphaerae]
MRIIFFSSSSIFLINSAQADTQKLIIESGDSSLSRQQAEMERDQWKDTRTLRQKMNDRAEKEWDKKDAAIDDSYACQTSDNHQLYWEPNTRRCLDRSTGRAVKP